MITRTFETNGYKVEVKGQLDASGSYEIDVIVEGFGSQGGTETLTSFSKNGIDYVAIVGKLPLTQEQLDIIREVRQELMMAVNELYPERKQYGVWAEVEINNPWMKGTY